MKDYKLTGVILIILLAILAILLFLMIAPVEGRNEYFEGKVLDNDGDVIKVQIEFCYGDLKRANIDIVEIEIGRVLRNDDFTRFQPGVAVRVLYGNVDQRNKRIVQIFSIYMLTEVNRHPK